jgi:hypothetical protein
MQTLLERFDERIIQVEDDMAPSPSRAVGTAPAAVA